MDYAQTQTKTDVVILKGQDLTFSSGKESKKKDIPKYWDRDYINSIINSVPNYKYKMLIKFLWMSGVRITEAVNLTKGNIDFENYVMVVKWLKSRKYKERVVPIHPLLREILQVYVANLKDSDRVFPITRQRAFQITMKYLGGSPHQLRHSFAVNWLRCDGDLVILHKILGHSKIQTTMEYLKIVPTEQGKELLKITF